MQDRIAFPAELIESAAQRLKQIARTLDELSGMLSAAEKSVDLDTLKKSRVLDELTRYEKRLLLAQEEAQRLSRALERAWEDFLGCEHETRRDFLRIQDAVLQADVQKKPGEAREETAPFA